MAATPVVANYTPAAVAAGAGAHTGKHAAATGVNGTQCNWCNAMVYHLATALGMVCPYCNMHQLAYPHVTGACGNGPVCMHS